MCIIARYELSRIQVKKTVTGKSSWTICKGIAKIVIGAPLAFGGFKGFLVSLPMLGVGVITSSASRDRDDRFFLMMGFGGSVISAGCLVGGGALAYSGVKDLNEDEESEVELT